MAFRQGEGDSSSSSSPWPSEIMGSTSASRLLSYRLFVEHLLEPDEVTVSRALESAGIRAAHHRSLLASYFEVTAEASFLCSLLLKDVDAMRTRYNNTNKTAAATAAPFSPTTFSNPFLPSAPSPTRFRAMRAQCSHLLNKLDLSRHRTQARLRLLKRIKLGSAMFLGALALSLALILALHAIPIVVATPAFIHLLSTKNLANCSAQLDVAAKGAYILIKDLDTISRLVARLNDELEDMHATARFWLHKSKHQLQPSGQVAQQLKKNDISFIEQLDELEEHLFLCFMTINRARSLVVKEISKTGRPDPPPDLLPK